MNEERPVPKASNGPRKVVLFCATLEKQKKKTAHLPMPLLPPEMTRTLPFNEGPFEGMKRVMSFLDHKKIPI